jgi:hypothetical protein
MLRLFLIDCLVIASSGLSYAVTPAAPANVSLAATPSSAAYGSLFTLVATVQDQRGNPVTTGSVTFHDGASVLGTVGVVSTSSGGGIPGTAKLNTILVPLGSNNIAATYTGSGAATGASATAVVTVIGQYPSTTTLAALGSAGDYALTATLLGAGPIPPTGSVLFTDATTGLEIGAEPLDPVALVQTFTPGSVVSGLTAPLAVSLADLNGDGIPDLVTGSPAGLFVELGNGNGTFQASVKVSSASISFENNPYSLPGTSIFIGDFNRDGHPDIAFVSCAGGICAAGIALGNGDGTFQPERDYDQTAAIGGIAVGDFNGDGVLDLAVANSANGTVDLLLGNGDGTFQPPQTTAMPCASSIASADLNSDGLLDLAVSNGCAGAVSVLLGNGDGTFQPPQPYAAGVNPALATLADLSGIGVLDIVVLDGSSTVSVLPGNGDGTFQPARPVYAPASPAILAGLAAADVNGDGIPDLVLIDQAGHAVDVLPGNGDGTFQSPAIYPVAAAPAGLALGDLNHDGRLDLAVASPGGNSITILLNKASQTATLTNAFLPGSGTQSVSAAYSGDASFALSSSNSLTVSAGLVTPAMSLTALPAATLAWGQPLSLTITLAAPNSLLPTPSGTVKFSIDGGTAVKETLTEGSVVIPVSQLAAGVHCLSATYGGNKDYAALPAQTLALTITPTTPAISWATPAAISYGTALNVSQLKANSKVAGTFVYFPAAGAILTAGSQTLSVTFTPADAIDYTPATATVQLTVNQVTPVLCWPAPRAIGYGTALGAGQLNATSKVAGTFAYSPAAGAVPTAGSQTLSVTFTPTDSLDYAPAAASVPLTVNVSTPAVSWPAPAAIPYGTALGAAQLDAATPVAGTFTYSPAAGTILTAGPQTLSVTFTPADAIDYTLVTATVNLIVCRAKPAIVWATPSPVAYGTTLSAAQLNASSPAAGSYSYSASAGTVLTPGAHILSVAFTPADTADYTLATAVVTLLVGPEILAQPSSLTVVSGHAATFSVAATGAPGLSYQWQYLCGTTWKTFGAGTGTATASLTTFPTNSALNGLQLRVVVTDANGLLSASNAATLTVSPAVTTQPTSQTVPLGSAATFSMAVDGVAPISYDWQYQSGCAWKDFAAGTGLGTPVLTTPPTTAAFNAVEFRVVVTDANGFTVISNQFRLMVGPAIVSQPVSQIVTDGAEATFSVATASIPGSGYSWQFWNGASWQQFGPNQGAATPTLTTKRVSAASDGLQVRVVVTDRDNLSAVSNTVTLNVAPAITVQPTRQTEPVYWSATFTVTAIGVPNLTYQWQYLSGTTWKPFAAGTGFDTNTLTTAPTTLALNGLQFRVVITDGNGLTVTSKAVTLTVIL